MVEFISVSLIELIGLLSVMAAAVSAIFSARAATIAQAQALAAEEQARVMAESHRLSVDTSKAQSLFEIANRWSSIYAARNAVLASDVVTESALTEKYGANFGAFLNDEDDWKMVRDVCNFFELLGMLLRKGFIDREALFVVVTVDRFTDPEFPDGVMFGRLRGRIDYLRKFYREDIYEYYDNYLLPEYREYLKLPSAMSGLRTAG